MRRKAIDEEIDELKNELDNLGDIHPAYLTPELRELQARVISTHAHLEELLEIRIGYQFRKEGIIKKGEDGTDVYFSQDFYRILSNYVSFRNKIEIVKEYNDNFPVNNLLKVNSYRNEFAHPKGMKLRDKYNYSTSSGKINIRDLLRCLILANKAANIYAEDIYLRSKII